MALFSKKEDKKDKKELAKESKKENAKPEAQSASKKSDFESSAGFLNDIILSPRISEKSVKLMDEGVYTFNVRADANKSEVAKAVELIYKVKPLKVNIINTPNKRKMNHKTGKWGEKKRYKKALVYLKEGDSISII